MAPPSAAGVLGRLICAEHGRNADHFGRGAAARIDGVNDVAVGILSLLVLLAAVRTGQGMIAKQADDGSRWPVATVAALLAVGVPTMLQLTLAPSLLDDLERDRAAIGDGQIWRLATSLVVQDGGWVGSVFNLVALAVVGAIAERVWGTNRWIVIALGSGVVGQLWGLVVQPVGAGNSVAVFGLAASIAVLGLPFEVGAIRVPAALVLFGTAALLVVGDIHGGAGAAGAAIGLILATVQRQSASPP